MANNRHRRVAKLRYQERIRRGNQIKAAYLEIGQAVCTLFSGFKKALDNAIKQINKSGKTIAKTNKVTEVTPWHNILPPPDCTADLFTPRDLQKKKSIEN